jgi:hypothetical protein
MSEARKVVLKVAGRGVVCRVKSRSAVILTADFEFVEIRKRPGIQTGQEVPFTAADLVRYRRPTRLLALAASFMVLFLAAFLAMPRFTPGPAVYAYVGVEVNPGIELALDRSLTVIGVEALNTDGVGLVQKLDLVGLPAAEAVAAVVRACQEHGYLGRGPDVRHLVVTTTFSGEEGRSALQAELFAVIQAKLEDAGGQTGVYILNCSIESRERARHAALSPAHYVIWQKALEGGIALDTDTVRAGKLREALNLEGRDFGMAVAALATMQGRVGRSGEETPVDPGSQAPETPPGHGRRVEDPKAFPGKPSAQPGGKHGVPAVPADPPQSSTGGDQDDPAPANAVAEEEVGTPPELQTEPGGKGPSFREDFPGSGTDKSDRAQTRTIRVDKERGGGTQNTGR